MGKKLHSSNVISEQTLHEILLDIKYRLDHLEDIEADNRSLIVKLIKQSNSIVKFLAQIDVETKEISFEDVNLPTTKKDKSFNSKRMKEIKELVDEYMSKRKDLKEFEEELKKHKDNITPGQIGEA